MSDKPTAMYRWRKWSARDREIVLNERRQRHHPWHSPPHIASDSTSLYLITAACFEHKPVIGSTDERIAGFCETLLSTVSARTASIYAWVVLPNHYHLLLNAPDLKELISGIGQMHGRLSFQWNTEDQLRGKRQVWCRCSETAMKSEGHFMATINYVHHNPVRHGYCEKWTQWPYSSATDYLADVGDEVAKHRWKKYPLYDYGAAW